jgi:hypothetical protein
MQDENVTDVPAALSLTRAFAAAPDAACSADASAVRTLGESAHHAGWAARRLDPAHASCARMESMVVA